MSVISYILVFGLIAAFSASVIWALWWAVRGGQFSNFQRGAVCIFDDEEPQGYRTDGFPEEDSPQKRPQRGETQGPEL